jgi:battenin
MNNAGYIIMLAGAKNIDPSKVGLVYVCNIVPSFTVKLTGPYWFHYVSYKRRMDIAALSMALSFILVAIGKTSDNEPLELLGIIIGSAQSGFGEASFLALTSFYDSRIALTAWSSGTGFAGPVGYFWVVLFNIWLGLDFSTTLYFALILPVIYWVAYNHVLTVPSIERDELDALPSLLDNKNDKKNDKINDNNDKNISIDNVLVNDAAVSMTISERFHATLKLWPFMLPLFIVYFAEYTIQSGIWSAYGFPITDKNARDSFYVYSNWLYQFGVLVSRSSGTIYKANMFEFWLMPACQVVILVFFLLDAYYQFWYMNYYYFKIIITLFNHKSNNITLYLSIFI